jgi:flagellar biosynthesis protein FlhA
MIYSLDPFIEDLVKDSLQKTDYGIFLAMAPDTAQEIITALQGAVDKATAQNVQPIVVCSPGVRRHLRRLVERHLPTLRVLSHHELVTEAKIQSLGVVSLSHEA